MDNEVSLGLVVQDKNLLMFFDENSEEWNVPNTSRNNGEISADAAVRAVEDMAGCSCKVSRYRSKIKRRTDHKEEELTVQPYSVELEGEPKKGEWVPISQVDEKQLAHPVTHIKEKIAAKL